MDSTGPIGRPAIAGRFSLWTRANEKDILDTPLTKKTIMKHEHRTDREEFFLVDSKKSFRPSFFFVKSRVCGVGCCLLFFSLFRSHFQVFFCFGFSFLVPRPLLVRPFHWLPLEGNFFFDLDFSC